jgi:hypothetical protein
MEKDRSYDLHIPLEYVSYDGCVETLHDSRKGEGTGFRHWQTLNDWQIITMLWRCLENKRARYSNKGKCYCYSGCGYPTSYVVREVRYRSAEAFAVGYL